MGITEAWKGEMRYAELRGPGLWPVENSKDAAQLGGVNIYYPFFIYLVPEMRLFAPFLLSSPLFVLCSVSFSPFPSSSKTEIEQNLVRIFPVFFVRKASTQLCLFTIVFTADNSSHRE